MRILVVDDEPDIAEVFKGTLETVMGATVTAAVDPLQALARYRPGSYDLVLTDERMPGMTGTELIRALRSAGYTGPCLMVSAYGSADTQRLAREAGAQGYISKPVGVDALVRAVQAALRAA